VCVSANYRLNDSDPLRDVEQVIAWVRDHGRVDWIPPGADHLGETVHYVYDYTFPFAVRLDIQSDAGSTILFSPTLPIAARRSSMWVLFARNHSFDRPDGDWVAFSEAIWAEDQAVTPRDRPRASPGAAISTRNARARRAGASKRRGRMCTVAATRAVSMRRRRRVRRSGTSVIGPAG
jgi:hypothetical protein